MDLSNNLGLELIQRTALSILFQNLDSKIGDLSPGWESQDDAFYDSLGRDNPGITIETIPGQNFIPGSIPSLINSPVGNYPNITCIAYSSRPKRSSDDTGENYTVNLSVEVMVKSDNFDDDNSHFGEEQVNSRIQKTLEAVHAVFLDNPTLGNTVIGLGSPAPDVGDVFVRRAEKSLGKRWFWQAGKLDYVVDKYVNFAHIVS